MIWVSWRRQRTESMLAAAIVVLITALLVPTGIEMANSYHHYGLSACLGPNASGTCGEAVGQFMSRWESIGNLTAWFTLVPGLIGVLLAASFVVELENGTHRLAWTQSVTRGRWIAVRLTSIVAVGVLAAVALIVLVTWWRAPFARLNGRMETSTFDFAGTVAVGYVLFTLGLALAVGVVWRRTVPALIAAFMGYFAARIFVDTWLRQRFESPLTATWHASRLAGGSTDDPPASLNHAWVLSQYPTDKHGHKIDAFLGVCARGTGNVRAISRDCIAQHFGTIYSHAVYQPASRFWLFQGIETALFGGTAVALIVFAAWWTHRRVA